MEGGTCSGPPTPNEGIKGICDKPCTNVGSTQQSGTRDLSTMVKASSFAVVFTFFVGLLSRLLVLVKPFIRYVKGTEC